MSGQMTSAAKERGLHNLDEFVKTLNGVCDLIKNRITES